MNQFAQLDQQQGESAIRFRQPVLLKTKSNSFLSSACTSAGSHSNYFGKHVILGFRNNADVSSTSDMTNHNGWKNQKQQNPIGPSFKAKQQLHLRSPLGYLRSCNAAPPVRRITGRTILANCLTVLLISLPGIKSTVQ
jgi:hypothetical protein